MNQIEAFTKQIGHALSAAESDVLDERRRQKEVEGWTAQHDDMHSTGDLAAASACYALAAADQANWPKRTFRRPEFWPFATAWWKPRTQRENLVRAGALILAEIDRLDRAALNKDSANG